MRAVWAGEVDAVDHYRERVDHRCLPFRPVWGHLPTCSVSASATPIVPAQRPPFASTCQVMPPYSQWIQAKGMEDQLQPGVTTDARVPCS